MKILAKWNAMRTARWLAKYAQVGQHPYLRGRPTIYAEGQVIMGSRVHISSQPVASHLAAGPDGSLHIGDNVSIGCGAAIAAYQRIDIGSDTRIGPFAIIMDTNFHGASGDQSVHHDCRPVIIGKGCLIGSRVTITRGASIGDGAEILAGSVVSSNIPPGVCAAGARARVIGLAGERSSRWESAAAVLPDMLMASLKLASPPDIDNSPIPTHLWTDALVQDLLGEIEDHLGVVLDHASAVNLKTFADMAAAVQQALWERSSRPQRSW